MHPNINPGRLGFSIILLFWHWNIFAQPIQFLAPLHFDMPLLTMKPTSGFGWRIHPLLGIRKFHAGIDLAANHDRVFCIMAGVVHATGYNDLLGNYIIVDHGGMRSIYCHLSIIMVEPGENVSAGTTIAITGLTGRVTGEHLHLAIRIDGHYLDPMLFFKQALISTRIKEPP
jgi:murein DD-endopeptidase MepM/ murein hydrolase activator NlpD